MTRPQLRKAAQPLPSIGGSKASVDHAAQYNKNVLSSSSRTLAQRSGGLGMTRDTANQMRSTSEQNDPGMIKLLFDYQGAADALSMSKGALRDLVYKGRGPVVTRIGTRVFFTIIDLEQFVDQHRECRLN